MFYVFNTNGTEGWNTHIVEATKEEIETINAVFARSYLIEENWGGSIPHFDDTEYETEEEAIRSYLNSKLLDGLNRTGISAKEYLIMRDYLDDNDEAYRKLKVDWSMVSSEEILIYHLLNSDVKEMQTLRDAILEEVK